VTTGDPAGVAHLYVHLPFCAARCGYCAFVVEVGREDARDAYLSALLAELERERAVLGPLETVYLGGGTPTLMGAERLAVLLGRIAPLLAPGAEVSVEANPETFDAHLVEALADGGVTRLSLGAQSSRPHLLEVLDRRSTPADAERAVRLAREAGIPLLSIDLMLAVPGQSAEDLAADLAWVTAAGPDHVSWYELEFKEGSAIARGPARAPDEDLAADLYLQAVEGLETAGYRWYELANFCRPGSECRHSLAYWHARDYLGLGVGAVSTVCGERRRNAPGLDRYIAALSGGEDPPRTREDVGPDTRRRERWMLGTRLDEPLDLAWAGPPDNPDALEVLAQRGLVERGEGTVRLTRRGRLLQNAVVQQIMDFS
jgi:putative oxygen-independent coproporphyrinogen III oxidase